VKGAALRYLLGRYRLILYWRHLAPAGRHGGYAHAGRMATRRSSLNSSPRSYRPALKSFYRTSPYAEALQQA